MYRLTEVIATVDPEGYKARLGAIRMWVQRGWLLYISQPTQAGVDPDVPPFARGTPGYLSCHRALQVATAIALVDYGLHPVPALRAAAHFSDFGGAEAAYGGAPNIQRLPGGLYREGKTILGVWRSDEGLWDGWAGHVVNVTQHDNFDQILHKLTHGFPPPTKPLRITYLNCADVLQSLKPLLEPPGDAPTRALAKSEEIEKHVQSTLDRLDRKAAQLETSEARKRRKNREPGA